MFHQARKLLRELKYHKRCEEAVTTIAAYWHGTQVLESRREVLLVTACTAWVLHRVRSIFLLKTCLLFLPNDPKVSQRFFNEARPEYCRCFLFNPTLFCWSHSFHFSLLSPTALFITFPSFSLHTLNLSHETPTTSRQARTELRRLKQEVRNKHAVTVIWAYWQGTKVFQPQLWCRLSRCLVIPVHCVPLLSQSHHDRAVWCSSSSEWDILQTDGLINELYCLLDSFFSYCRNPDYPSVFIAPLSLAIDHNKEFLNALSFSF